MAKVKVGEKEYDAGSAEHVKALEGAVAFEKARADSVARGPTQEEIRKAASARAVLLAGCQKIATDKGQRFDADAAEGSDDSALMIESIKQVDPAFEPPKGGSPDFVSGFLHGYFRAIVSTLKGAAGPEVSEQDAKKEPEAPAAGAAAPAAPAAGNVPPPAAGGRSDTNTKSIFTARSGSTGTAATAVKDDILDAQTRNAERSANAWKGEEKKK